MTGLGILLSRRASSFPFSSSSSSSSSDRDVDKALAYFEKAAKKGYMEAFYQMGMLHLELGEEAGQWLRGCTCNVSSEEGYSIVFGDRVCGNSDDVSQQARFISQEFYQYPASLDGSPLKHSTWPSHKCHFQCTLIVSDRIILGAIAAASGAKAAEAKHAAAKASADAKKKQKQKAASTASKSKRNSGGAASATKSPSKPSATKVYCVNTPEHIVGLSSRRNDAIYKNIFIREPERRKDLCMIYARGYRHEQKGLMTKSAIESNFKNR